ncbi:hypothetical protein COU77_01860 [Candidatus Peregrinibacteria bacterium CG10_big_fil_rev_8_21_14_0_10_49_16]|nr:MAG: hypothetical protein COW95_00390 [Candidatus Peregrinibacteria bacterium CG22_combo_CG10-13_8_21_14_all_49_11]PIR52160.1 MAG: hypothetical protein COU77_01860 [Candidatus Peregrinibacteria bacterium CG10_big_fil_rev_8_21_14_0_10_49_16]
MNYLFTFFFFTGLLLTSCIPSDGSTNEDIHVFSPQSKSIVAQTFTIEGEARGYWYFEATFPLRIEDKDGHTLLQSYATAQDDWMTEEYVPFTEELSVEVSEDTPSVLILEKSNPSGLPEHAAEIRIPITITPGLSPPNTP